MRLHWGDESNEKGQILKIQGWRAEFLPLKLVKYVALELMEVDDFIRWNNCCSGQICYAAVDACQVNALQFTLIPGCYIAGV